MSSFIWFSIGFLTPLILAVCVATFADIGKIMPHDN